jgi:hypothetical protein
MMTLAGAWLGSDMPVQAATGEAQAAPTQAPADPQAAPAQPDRDRQVASLAALLIAVLAKGGRQSAQIEAQLSLLISQAQSGCGDSKAALTQAATQAGPLNGAAAVALKNISGALERCEVEGTAALADAQTVVEQGTTLGLSGGSSNYTPPQTATAGGPSA